MAELKLSRVQRKALDTLDESAWTETYVVQEALEHPSSTNTVRILNILREKELVEMQFDRGQKMWRRVAQ